MVYVPAGSNLMAHSMCPRWSSYLSNEVGEVAMSLRAPNYGELASIDYSKPPRSMGLGCTMSGNACWIRPSERMTSGCSLLDPWFIPRGRARSMVLSCGLTLIRLSFSVTCWVVFSKCLVSRSRLSRSAGSSILLCLMPIGESLNPWNALLAIGYSIALSDSWFSGFILRRSVEIE